MKQFKFKLEPLLKIRRFEEKQKFTEFARVLGKRNENNVKIQEAEKAQAAQLHNESLRMAEGKFDIGYSIQVRHYLKNLSRQKTVARRNIEEMQSEYQAKLKEANAYRIKRKTLELLKEKNLKKYNEEINKAEVKMLDDFNQNRQRRRSLYDSDQS